MTTERIEIIVSEKGTKTVQRSLEGIGSSAQKSSSSVDLLKRALLALGGVAIARKLVEMADTFTLIQNRLGTVTESTSQLVAVNEELFKIAQATRQNFQATAEVYARTALATKELGISQAQTLAFTKSLNQAVILSGASAQEAQAGLIQLSQGLASGALRGDELRSVLEQLPAVADVIAKGLGVTRGELRKMGEEGQITADIILSAFADSAQSLNDRFAKTVPTIGQSFGVLQNSIIQFIGQVNKSIGATELISSTLLGLASNIDIVARAFGALSLVLGVQFAQVAIGRAIAGLKALRVALLANPVTAIIVALTSAVAFLATFSDKISATTDGITTLADVGVAAFSMIGSALSAFVDYFQAAFGPLLGVVQNFFGEFQLSFKDLLKLNAYFVDRFIGVYIGAFKAIKAVFSNLPAFFQEIFLEALNFAVVIVEEAVNSIVDLLNNLPGIEIPDINVGRLEAQAAQGGQDVGAAFMEGFNTKVLEAGVDNLFAEADKIAAARVAGQAAAAQQQQDGFDSLNFAGERKAPGQGDRQLQDTIKDLERENVLLSLNTLEREKQAEIFKLENQIKRQLTESEREHVAALVQANQQAAIRSQLLDEIRGPQDAIRMQQSELNKLYEEGMITLQQYNLAMAKLSAHSLEYGTTVADGFKRGFQKIKAEILDVSAAAEQTLTNAFHTAEDSLVEFVKTGQFNFSSLVDSILADLTRLLAKQALASLLGAIGGGGNPLGTVLSSAFGGARAEGGAVNPNQAFLVGERGPEMFVPPGRGNIVPNEGLRAPAMQPSQVNVQVINVQDPSEIPSAMDSREGDQVILNSLARNPEVVKQRLNIA